MACLQERDLLSITFLVHVYICAYMASTCAIREIMREILTSSVDGELVKTQKHQQAPRFHVVTMTVLRCWWLCFSQCLRPSLAVIIVGSHQNVHMHTPCTLARSSPARGNSAHMHIPCTLARSSPARGNWAHVFIQSTARQQKRG
jgi:hypothetical protein